MACGLPPRGRRCPGRAGSRAGATAPRPPGRRSTRWVQRLPVGRGGEGDARVRVQVVDVRAVDQAVHRRVDRRGRAALAVQAVVERGDHLVLAVDAGIDVGQRAQPVQAQHGEPGSGERAEVAAGSLDPQQLDAARRSPGRSRCPSPRCCRRRSWCSAGRSRAGCERSISSATTGARRQCHVSCHLLGAPAGLVAADPFGYDALGVAGARRRPPSGRGRVPVPRAPRRAAGRTSVL